MMKHNFKKLITLLFAFAVVIGCMALTSVDAQAATKTHTYKHDAKKGVIWESAVRANYNSRYSDDATIYLQNEGDYISTVKVVGSGLVAKVTYTYTSSDESTLYLAENDKLNDQKYYSRSDIGFYASKPGTYTVKFTVKNAKGKTKCTKSVKVYVDTNPVVKSLKYSNTEIYGFSSFTTKKAKGKLKIKLNSGYTLKGIYMATTFDSDGQPIYKKIKNNKTITLAKETKYSQENYSYSGSSYSYSSVDHYDYLKPATYFKVNYYDKKLKILKTESFVITNIK